MNESQQHDQEQVTPTQDSIEKARSSRHLACDEYSEQIQERISILKSLGPGTSPHVVISQVLFMQADLLAVLHAELCEIRRELHDMNWSMQKLTSPDQVRHEWMEGYKK